MSAAAIKLENLSKVYGNEDSAALCGLSFSVERGEAVALIGSNGAGKSTVISILSTLLRPSSGRASVAGFDVLRDPARVRQEIGVVQQWVTLDPTARIRDILELHARLAGLNGASLASRVGELLELAGLERAARRRVHQLSGGMQRKLDISLALICEPPVLLLDEPTDNLDSPSRLEFWEELSRLRDTGTCVLFTSQDQEEIEYLADRVMVLTDGLLVREDAIPSQPARGWSTDVDAVAG